MVSHSKYGYFFVWFLNGFQKPDHLEPDLLSTVQNQTCTDFGPPLYYSGDLKILNDLDAKCGLKSAFWASSIRIPTVVNIAISGQLPGISMLVL